MMNGKCMMSLNLINFAFQPVKSPNKDGKLMNETFPNVKLLSIQFQVYIHSSPAESGNLNGNINLTLSF